MSFPPPLLALPVLLGERRDAGAGLTLVTLTPMSGDASSYRAPGQYLEVRDDSVGSNGYFALASDPGAPSWELLVRRNGGVSDVLLDAAPATELTVVGPLGDGFPIERTHGRSLVVAVAGSALAVARSLLRERISRREAPLTSVYIGARTVRDVALADEVAGWVHAGARVVLCLSRTTDEALATLSGTRRANGYVQKVLANDAIEGPIRDALVFAAGPARMLEDLRHLPKLEVITNV